MDGFKTSMGATSGAGVGPGATLSTLANYPKHKINKLISESKPLIGGARKCKQIWQAIRKADFRNEGTLNETNIRLIFETQKQQIYDTLRLQSPNEFLEVFDQGGDGQLNEDEQILVFSLIKEKMQILAEELCYVQEYALYKDLMREVRILETDINQYQNELRTNIQENQLREYVEIGDEQLQDFYRQWEQKFEEYEDESLMRIEFLKDDHEKQMEILNQKLDSAVENVKIKPKATLKEMQMNEKLVAVNERVEEAQNYRKELKNLEIQEAQRIEQLRQKNADNQRNKLLKQQQKEMKQLEAKIETGKHNLKIKRDKDLIVLQKQINLHVHDIERIQGMMTIEAHRKGDKSDELRRIKAKSRKTQAFLSESKKVQSSTIKAGDSTQPDKSMKQTMLSGAGSTQGGHSRDQNIMVDLLLFGQSAMQKRGLMSSSMNNSFQNTMSSSMGHPNQVKPLQYILKHAPLTTFEISVTNADGTRRSDTKGAGAAEETEEGEKKKEEEDKQKKKKKEKPVTKGPKSNAAKIQFFLDQRKPPTEQLKSLCAEYDDDLNVMIPEEETA